MTSTLTHEYASAFHWLCRCTFPPSRTISGCVLATSSFSVHRCGCKCREHCCNLLPGWRIRTHQPLLAQALRMSLTSSAKSSRASGAGATKTVNAWQHLEGYKDWRWSFVDWLSESCDAVNESRCGASAFARACVG